MDKYTFQSEKGYCPSCDAHGRRWYIQDREVYPGCYEFCLMSHSLGQRKYIRFRNDIEAARWLKAIDGELDESTATWILQRYSSLDMGSMLLLEKDGKKYRYRKTRKDLTELPERKKETGWFSSYRECLQKAKEILQRQDPEQMQL